MYQIIKTDGTELGVTDSVTYIKIGSSGCFTTASEDDAIGIAFRNMPYNLNGHDAISGAETVFIREIDVGEYVMQQSRVNEQNAANIDYLSMMLKVDL